MKSETLIKISENRKKYFLEVTKQQTEKSMASSNEQDRSEERGKKQTMDLVSLAKPMFQAFILVMKITFNHIAIQASGIRRMIKKNLQVPLEIISNRTEKVKARLFSFLLVLFDA